MGGGCFKPRKGAGAAIAPGSMKQEVLEGLPAWLRSLVQLAGRPSDKVTNDKLDEALDLLTTCEPNGAAACFKDCLSSASIQFQSKLLSLLARMIGHALDASVVIAEELLAAENPGVGNVANVGHTVSLCKDSLSINTSHQGGVALAMRVLSDAYATDSKVPVPIVPALDRLVLLLRPSLMAHPESSADNLLHWRELVACAGLPPLENHLALLSHGAKAVVLSLVLVPEEIPPLVVVANRDSALGTQQEWLPSDHACVLLPYFESSTGSKVVKGRRVEGGEGHGPRKEFFTASSAEAIKKWSPYVVPSLHGSADLDMQVAFAGSRITLSKASVQGETAGGSSCSRAQQLVSRAVANGCVGERIRLEFSNGMEVERVITATHGGTGISTNGDFGEASCDASAVCCCALQKPVRPLFEFHRGTGNFWFSAYATELDNASYGEELRQRFETFGKLLMLALVNRCRIAFLLPAVFFRLLLHDDVKLDLDDLKTFDNELYLALAKCEKMSASDFNSLKLVEGLPAHTSRDEYVSGKVKETFEPMAMQAIRKGFWSLNKPGLTFHGVADVDLHHLLCPVDEFNDKVSIRDIFKVEMEDEMANYAVFVDTFWSVVDGLPIADKKLFLRFVTGLDTLPEPGTERLLIELPFSAFSKEEQIAMLDLLPQAHTCSNTLEVPNYYEALKESGRIAGNGDDSEEFRSALHKILHTKLLVAIRETSGYELDATADATEAPRLKPEPTEALSSTLPSRNAAPIPFDAAPPCEGGPLAPAAVPASSPTQVAEAPPEWKSEPFPLGGKAEPASGWNSEPFLLPGKDKLGSDVDTFLAELELGLEELR